MAGEITSQYEPDVFGLIRRMLEDIGYPAGGRIPDCSKNPSFSDYALEKWKTLRYNFNDMGCSALYFGR